MILQRIQQNFQSMETIKIYHRFQGATFFLECCSTLTQHFYEQIKIKIIGEVDRVTG